MTERLDRPTYAGEISGLKQRVDALERKLRRYDTVKPGELTFVFSGPLYATMGVKKRAPEGRRYRVAVLDLGEAGATDTVVRLLRNGTVSAALTFTIPAGVVFIEARVSLVLTARTDYVQSELVTAGSGATNLTLDLWR